MSTTATPVFVQSAFGTTAVSFSALVTNTTAGILAGTGVTDILTGGTNGSRVDGIHFMIPTGAQETILLIYLYNGSVYKMCGFVNVKPLNPGSLPGVDNPPWEGFWVNPNKGPIASGNKLAAGALTGANTFHATPLGGNL